MAASIHGHIDIVRMLIEAKAQVNTQEEVCCSYHQKTHYKSSYPALLTLGAHAQRGLLGLSSVCPSVTTFSATMRSKAAKKRYQRVQCHTGLILKRAIFALSTAFKSYGVKKPIC